MTSWAWNLVLSFLSRDWAGLALALVVAVLGVWCISVARARGATWATGVGYLVLGIAGMLALGSIYHLVHMARVRAQYPPPGEMVDIGGYALHILAEGKARGKPTIVWIPGGHSPGVELYQLHKMLRDESRSILIDRPGSGWSDIGPFPRTTTLEASEVVAALENSGENGPFVLVGHSFGGLLVANIARRYPENIAGVVLLDATPPDAINYSPLNPILRQMRRDAMLSAIQRLFGIHPDVAQRRRGQDPNTKQTIDVIEKSMGEMFEKVQALQAASRSACAGASIFAELDHGGLGWETTVYDGDLGDLPVFLVAPGHVPMEEVLPVAKAMETIAGEGGGPGTIDATRLQRFYARTRERYLATSSRSERIIAPEGTGHLFPFETPEFVADVVRRMQEESRR
ncbi:MAG: alpha/beta fold hydrolase [Steroidobacteraceae bacterium]